MMATMAVITRTEESVNLVWVLIAVSYAGNQQELASRLPAFQVAMGLRGLGQRISAIHANLQFA